MNFPISTIVKNRKFIYIAACSFAVLFVIGGWWYAQSQAKETVVDFFDEHEQLDVVSYQDVSFNPLTGTLILSDIEIEQSNQTDFILNIDAVEIYDTKFEDNIPEHISFSIKGIQLDLLELIKNLNIRESSLRRIDSKNLMENKLATLFILGYYSLPVNITVDLRYDQDDKEFEWQNTIQADNLGEWSFHYELNNLHKRFFKFFDSQWIEEISVLSVINLNASRQRQTKLEKIMNAAKKTKLVSFKGNYTDLGLFKRIKHLTEIEHNYIEGDEHPFELSEKEKEEKIKLLKRNGASNEIAESLINAQANFLVDLDSISIETDLDDPVSIRKLERKDNGRVLKLLKVKGGN